MTAQGSIKDRLIYFAEVQPRLGDGVGRLDQLLLRPPIGWKLSDRVSVYHGYARVLTYISNDVERRENRTIQQLSWTLPQGRRAELQSRTRFEQRWRADGRDTGLRLREMVRGEIAFAPSGEGVRALGSVELFVALNDTAWGARGGFDQLRSFAGAEIPIAGKTTLDTGYLNQLIDPPDGPRRMNHVAAFNLFLRH